LKKRKPDWDDEFETEKRIYHHLKPLQGTFIPQFYGEGIYDGSPAFVLSEIYGERLFDIDFEIRPEADDPILEAKLEEAFKALTKYGVIHKDPEMHNIFEVEDRVMIIDFEQAELGSRVWEDSPNNGNVRYLMRKFRRARGGTEYILAENERLYKEIMSRVPYTYGKRPDIEIIAH
jgi:RIO-like serine/threonine protein kinase